MKVACLKAARGGTFCNSAFTVVSTMRGPGPSSRRSSRRVSVSMRRATISPFGDTRSYGRQSHAGNASTSTSGAKKASASASRAVRTSSSATCTRP